MKFWDTWISRTQLPFFMIFYVKFSWIVYSCKTFKSTAYTSWFNSELKRLVSLKKAAHITFKRTKSPADFLVFSRLRAECKFKSKICYKNYIASVENSVISNPKFFWKFVNNLRSSSRIPRFSVYNNPSPSVSVAAPDYYNNY